MGHQSITSTYLLSTVTGCILTNISDMKLYLILLVTLVCLAISTKANAGDTDFQMETNRKTKNSDNCKDEGEKCSKDRDCCSQYCYNFSGWGAPRRACRKK